MANERNLNTDDDDEMFFEARSPVRTKKGWWPTIKTLMMGSNQIEKNEFAAMRKWSLFYKNQ